MRDSKYFINEYYKYYSRFESVTNNFIYNTYTIKEMPSGHNWEDYSYPEYGSTRQVCTICFQVIRLSAISLDHTFDYSSLSWIGGIIPCPEAVMKRALR